MASSTILCSTGVRPSPTLVLSERGLNFKREKWKDTKHKTFKPHVYECFSSPECKSLFQNLSLFASTFRSFKRYPRRKVSLSICRWYRVCLVEVKEKLTCWHVRKSAEKTKMPAIAWAVFVERKMGVTSTAWSAAWVADDEETAGTAEEMFFAASTNAATVEVTVVDVVDVVLISSAMHTNVWRNVHYFQITLNSTNS